MKKFDLSGKAAVITGANKGIGLGITKTLARNGAETARSSWLQTNRNI